MSEAGKPTDEEGLSIRLAGKLFAGEALLAEGTNRVAPT